MERTACGHELLEWRQNNRNNKSLAHFEQRLVETRAKCLCRNYHHGYHLTILPAAWSKLALKSIFWARSLCSVAILPSIRVVPFDFFADSFIGKPADFRHI